MKQEEALKLLHWLEHIIAQAQNTLIVGSSEWVTLEALRISIINERVGIANNMFWQDLIK